MKEDFRDLRKEMERTEKSEGPRNWMATVLTDTHFWVPIAVLVGGLLLLRFIQ
jgi:hypothetical protein